MISTHDNSHDPAQDIIDPRCVPVFKIDRTWHDGDDPLPAIWTTMPLFDENDEPAGRMYDSRYPWDDDPDPEGDGATFLGARYYNEAMSYAAPEDRETRIECFRAAEILYLHGAAKGNVIAYANLGYVYSYDRCEGRYFVDTRHAENANGSSKPYPREERAFECFSYAAKHDDAEACYKLGDMLKRGTGCEANPAEALRWYMRAYELKDGEPPHVWGSIALRLADAYENAYGCELDLEKALEWYKKAEAGLDIGVRSGATFYNKTLANVRAAIKRLEQELDGTY